MIMPTPGDMGLAPQWDNYLVAQAVQATLGLIPSSALGISISISDTDVKFEFQLAELSEGDETDIADIIDNFNMLIGFVVPVSSTTRLVPHRQVTPSRGSRERWVFSKRPE
jgi:hypothetical protein